MQDSEQKEIRKVVSVTMPPSLIKRVKEAAGISYRSFSSQLCFYAQQGIKRDTPEDGRR